eukprot:jgi/Ulvmu1/2474/UM136_0026.1
MIVPTGNAAEGDQEESNARYLFARCGHPLLSGVMRAVSIASRSTPYHSHDGAASVTASKDGSSTVSDNATISDPPPGSPAGQTDQTSNLLRPADDPAERPQLINAGSSIASSNPPPARTPQPAANGETASAPFTLARAAQAAGVWNPGGAVAGAKQLPSMASANVAPGATLGFVPGRPSATTASPMIVPFLGSGDAGEALRNGAVASSCLDAGTGQSGSLDVAGTTAKTGDSQGRRPGNAAATDSHAHMASTEGRTSAAVSMATDKPSGVASATVLQTASCMHEAADDAPATPLAAERMGSGAGAGDAERDPLRAVDGSAYISVEDAAELRAALEGCHAVPDAERALHLEPGGASAVIEKCASGMLQVADLMQLVPWTRPPGMPPPPAQRTSSDGAPADPPATSAAPSAASHDAAAQNGADAAAVGDGAKVSTAAEVAEEVGVRARSLFMQLSDCGALPRVPLQRTATPIVPVPAPGMRGGRWPKAPSRSKPAADKPPVVGHGVPVLYPSRSSGGLKAQPSLLNQQSALFNNPSSKGKLLFPSRPKDPDATAGGSGAALQSQPSTDSRPAPSAAAASTAPSAAPLHRLASSSSAQQSGALELVTQHGRGKQRGGSAAGKGGGPDWLLSSETSSRVLPSRERSEAYLALVVQVAVVADGGVSAAWCRSLRVASSVLARAVFRKALELYECGTRPHHLQPLLRLQTLKRKAHTSQPG